LQKIFYTEYIYKEALEINDYDKGKNEIFVLLKCTQICIIKID
jgi:hypothetical protein